MLQRGQNLADQGDWEIAAGTFARVVGSSDPALHTAALLGLAECRYRLDDEPAALQAWISATQAPENPLTWRAWKALAAARVRSGDTAGAARAYREAARRAPASEQAELQSRIGWLSKELGDEQGSQRAFSRTRASGLPQPIVTYGLLAVTVTVSLMTLVGGLEELESWLLLDKFALFFDNEYWRLFTVTLVHGNIVHLMFNMYALWIIGPIVEALYGPWRYLAIYLICAAAGSAASYATSFAPAVGASGAVFGLFGTLLVADHVHKPALTRNARNLTMQIGVLIGINLLIGFSVPGIDNAAHIGGLLAGAALGFLVVPQGARLDTFWYQPPGLSGRGSGSANSTATSTASSTASGSGAGSSRAEPARLVRLGGVALLVGAITLVVLVSPVTWQPRDVLLRLGQVAPVGETVGDAVAVSPGLSVALRAGVPGGGRRAQRQFDGQRATWHQPGSLVTQHETPPGGHAVGQTEAPVEGPSLDGISAPERVAA